MGFAQSEATLEGRKAGLENLPSLEAWTAEMQNMFKGSE